MTRMTPDGREVYEISHIRSRRSRVAVIRGEGLKTKIVVGAQDLPDEVFFDIQNRDTPRGLAYDSIEYLHSGMLGLPKDYLQGGDQTYSPEGGATFGIGELTEDHPKAGEIRLVEGDPKGDNGAWIVTWEGGKGLLFIDKDISSTDLMEWMCKNVKGEFCIEMISAGCMTAADDLAVNGWVAIMSPAPAPSPRP